MTMQLFGEPSYFDAFALNCVFNQFANVDFFYIAHIHSNLLLFILFHQSRIVSVFHQIYSGLEVEFFEDMAFVHVHSATTQA